MPLSKSLTIRLHPEDNVIVALEALEARQEIAEENIVCRDPIPESHKVATMAIDKGSPILKYGQIIGAASVDIESGEHVHTHNLDF